MGERPIVYYDGACPVCAREIGYYQQRKEADLFSWVDVTCADASVLGSDLSRADALARMHVRRADGSLAVGAAAFAEIWRPMPGLSYLAALIATPPFNIIAEWAYRGFLRLRKIWRS